MNLFNEYIEENLVKKYKEVIDSTPKLLEIIDKVFKYVEEKGYCKNYN
jgi:CRISPR/Cas system endoribonuclease Cas6 (RAMP superfamily)